MTTSNGHQILLVTRIDDFIITCEHRPILDSFRDSLLAHFDGTTEFSELMDSGALSLSRLSFPPTPNFPKMIVILLLITCFTYVITVLWEVWTTSDLTFAYSEISKYVQRPRQTHMTSTDHTLWCLRDTF
jgi:hypothetical protein